MQVIARWPVLAEYIRRVAQKVEIASRRFADARLLVHRQLQLAHDLPQSLQGFFAFAPSTQDHEVGVGHEPRAQGSLEPEHLPSQHNRRM